MLANLAFSLKHSNLKFPFHLSIITFIYDNNIVSVINFYK